MYGRAYGAALVALHFLISVVPSIGAPTFTTIDVFAGTGTTTFDPFENEGGLALETMISPGDLAVDSAGNVYFVGSTAQGACNCLGAAPQIRRIDAATNIVTTVVGDGTDDFADENVPAISTGVAISRISLAGDDRLLIGDKLNQRIRGVDLGTGLIQTIAGNGAFNAIYNEGGLAITSPLAFPDVPVASPSGDVVFAYGFATPILFGNPYGSPVLRVDADSGILSTYANVPLNFQALSMAFDDAGNLYMSGFNQGEPIYRVDAISGTVTPFAGGGSSLADTGAALDTDLAQIGDVTYADGYLFVASTYFMDGPGMPIVDGSLIWVIDLADGSIDRVAGDLDAVPIGNGGPAINAKLNAVSGLAVAPDGDLLISTDNTIRRVERQSLVGDILIDDTTSQAFLDSLTNAPANLLAEGTSRIDILMPNLLGVANDLAITDNANLTTLAAPMMAHVDGHVTIVNNPNLQSVDLGVLGTTGGDITVTDNATASTIDLGSLDTAGGDITIVGNDNAEEIIVGSIVSIGGDITVTDNGVAMGIDLGNLDTAGGDITVTDNGMASIIDLGNVTNVGGDLTIDDNDDPTITFTLPQITVVGSVTIGDADVVIQSGSVFDFAQDLKIGDRASLDVEQDAEAKAATVQVQSGGAARGHGTIAASTIFNSGIFAPGHSPGVLTADGDFIQDADGTLVIEIAGLEPGTSYDVLHVTGNLSMGGMILLRFLDGFAPQQGQQFEFLTVDGQADVGGATFEPQNLAPGFVFSISSSASGIMLTALSDGRFVAEPSRASMLVAAALAVTLLRPARRCRALFGVYARCS